MLSADGGRRPMGTGAVQSTFMNNRREDFGLLKVVSYPFSYESDARIIIFIFD